MAAWRAGYHWPTLCYGMGSCNACQCEVVEGHHLTSPRTDVEVQLLGDLNKRVRRVNPRRVRLACQLTITGDVTVRKAGVKIVDQQADLSAGNSEETLRDRERR